MRAATQPSSDPSPTADQSLPVVEFDFDPAVPPQPDRDAVASVDALLASLDPDTARHALRECLAEIVLWQHHLRVRESRYASDKARPRELFHIG